MKSFPYILAVLIVLVFGTIYAIGLFNIFYPIHEDTSKFSCFFSFEELKEMNLSLEKFYSFETTDRGCRIVEVLSEKEATKK